MEEGQGPQVQCRTKDKTQQGGTQDNRVGQQGGTKGWDKYGAGMHRLVAAYKGKIKVHRGSDAICHAVFKWCA